MEVAVGIPAHVAELPVGPDDSDAGQPVVGGPDQDQTTGASMERRTDTRHPTPVGVVDAGECRVLPVAAGANRSGDSRMQTVGADHEPGLQRDGCSTSAMALHPHHPTLRPQQLIGREPLDQLDAGLEGRLDEQPVEHRPARAVRVGHASDGGSQAGQLHRADIEGDLPDRSAAPGFEPVEQSPRLQSCRPALPQEMRGHRVARE
jgi:hypothetical protein